MKRRRPPLRARGRAILPLFIGLLCGGFIGWWIHATMSAGSSVASVVLPDDPLSEVAPTLPPPAAVDPPSIDIDPIAELRRHKLRLPVDEANVTSMKGSFGERRSGGSRGHEAVDLMAPRQTPVHAVENGSIARLFFSKAGGITVYQFDPTRRFCYYYAHLERYAAGLREGQDVSSGDVIGYVGTTGNAPKDTPHLHFAVFQLTDDSHWWEGRPLDPYLIFKEATS